MLMCHTFAVIVTQTERCSMNTTNGKIAEQSKQKIANALLVILKQYDYKEITITQLVGAMLPSHLSHPVAKNAMAPITAPIISIG